MTTFADVVAQNQDVLDEAGITPGPRRNMFFAQLGHESNLQPVDEVPSQYASSQSHYHGRGYIQLTGEDNYRKYGDAVGADLVNNPDLAKDPQTALKIAAAYWRLNGLNEKADAGDYNGISAAIGGQGYHGHESRVAWLQKVQALDDGNPDPASLAAKLQDPASLRKASFAQAASASKNKELFKSNPGTAEFILSQGTIQPSTTSGQMFDQAMAASYNSQNARLREIPSEIRNDTIAEAKDKYGIDIQSMMDEELQKSGAKQYYSGGQRLGITPPKFHYSEEDIQAAFDKSMRRAREMNPSFNPSLKSTLDINKETGARVSKMEEDYANSSSSATFTQGLSGLAGSILGFMRDPVNAAAMGITAFMGPTGMGLKAAAARAGIAGASEVPVQAALQPQKAEVQLPHGIGDAAANVAGVTAGAFAFDMFTQGLVKGVMKAFTKGPSGQLKVAEALKTGKAGDPEAPLPERVSDVMGNKLEDQVSTLKEAPMADTPQGRQTLVEQLDAADTQATLGKPVDVIPDDAPTYVKPLKKETQKLSDQILDEVDPTLKSESKEWEALQKKLASGTEEDAVNTKAVVDKEGPTARQLVDDANNARMAEIHNSMDTPEYVTKAQQDFDRFVERSAANIDFSITKTQEEITKLENRIARDKASLDNWDQIVDNPDIKEHLKSPTAREHISMRLEDQKVQLRNRQTELESLLRDKEAHIKQGTPTENQTQMIKTQDEFGNVIERPASDVINEIREERTALMELADCIKTGGIPTKGTN